jgi:hypothetical protein
MLRRHFVRWGSEEKGGVERFGGPGRGEFFGILRSAQDDDGFG